MRYAHTEETMRELLHSDLAHLAAIAEDTRRKCADIDRFIGSKYKSQTVQVKQKLAPPTMHDAASNNPILRDFLRRMQQG